MFTSLYTGVSGMRAYLEQMDVVANNLANINTIGFKKGRVLFREALVERLIAGTRPWDEMGGKNPIEIGLGVEIASIDNIFTQGQVLRTGVPTDMAILGDGFFVVRMGNAWYYTRDGSFTLDAEGRFVDSNGAILQGRMADLTTGEVPSGGKIEDIVIPPKLKIPAKMTSLVKLACNLDMREDPKPSIWDSQGLMAKPDQTEDMNGLYASGYLDNFLHLSWGDELTVDDGLGNQETYVYGVDFVSLQDLANAINTDFGPAGYNTLQVNLPASASGAPNIVEGYLEFVDLTGSDHTVTITSNNANLAKAFEGVDDNPINSTTGATTRSDTFSHIARASDWLVDLRTYTGSDIGIAAGDTFNVTAELAGTPISQTIVVTTAAPVANNEAQTYGDLITLLEDILSDGDVDPWGAKSVFKVGDVRIDSSDGSCYVEGDPGTSNAIDKLQCRIPGKWGFSFIKMQDAEDVTHACSIKIYDSEGEAHTLTITFKKDEYVDNKWYWSAEIENATIWEGGSGVILFNPDGSLAGFSYDGGANAIVFDPGPGKESPQRVQLWMGTLGGFDGVTQLAEPMTTLVIDQDGWAPGELMDFVIEEDGTIRGQFTNGLMRPLAKIVVATFNNPMGLKKIGKNLFAEAPNSGDPIIGDPMTSIPSCKIAYQSLEESNVDLAEEFVSMIMAQRGFQANSRLISVVDTMFGDALRMKMR